MDLATTSSPKLQRETARIACAASTTPSAYLAASATMGGSAGPDYSAYPIQASATELLAFSGLTGPEIAFSPDGKFLAAAGQDNTVRVYVLPVEMLVELAQTRLTRWFTPEECQRYLDALDCPPEP